MLHNRQRCPQCGKGWASNHHMTVCDRPLGIARLDDARRVQYRREMAASIFAAWIGKHGLPTDAKRVAGQAVDAADSLLDELERRAK